MNTIYHPTDPVLDLRFTGVIGAGTGIWAPNWREELYVELHE